MKGTLLFVTGLWLSFVIWSATDVRSQAQKTDNSSRKKSHTEIEFVSEPKNLKVFMAPDTLPDDFWWFDSTGKYYVGVTPKTVKMDSGDYKVGFEIEIQVNSKEAQDLLSMGGKYLAGTKGKFEFGKGFIIESGKKITWKSEYDRFDEKTPFVGDDCIGLWLNKESKETKVLKVGKIYRRNLSPDSPAKIVADFRTRK